MHFRLPVVSRETVDEALRESRAVPDYYIKMGLDYLRANPGFLGFFISLRKESGSRTMDAYAISFVHTMRCVELEAEKRDCALPIVENEAREAVLAELDKNPDYLEDLEERYEVENPEMIAWLDRKSRYCPYGTPMIYASLLTMRFLEKQIEITFGDYKDVEVG